MIEIYGRWQNHVLPLSGGSYDQPHVVLQAMDVIANTKARLALEAERKARGL